LFQVSGACYPLVPCSFRVSTIKMHTQSYITDSETFIYYTSTTYPVTTSNKIYFPVFKIYVGPNLNICTFAIKKKKRCINA